LQPPSRFRSSCSRNAAIAPSPAAALVLTLFGLHRLGRFEIVTEKVTGDRYRLREKRRSGLLQKAGATETNPTAQQ
jgi:hypothetical protein